MSSSRQASKRKQHDSDDEEARLFPDVLPVQSHQVKPMSGKKRLCKKSEKEEDHSDDDLMEEDDERQEGEKILSSTAMIPLSQTLPGKKRLSKKRQETSQPEEHSDDDLLEEGEQEGELRPCSAQIEATASRQTMLLPEKKRLSKQRKPETEPQQEYSDDDNDLLEEEEEEYEQGHETKTTYSVTDKDGDNSTPLSDHVMTINTMLDSDNVELLRNMLRVCKVVNKSPPVDDLTKSTMAGRKGKIRTDEQVVDLYDMLLQAIEGGAYRIVKELLLLSSTGLSVDDAGRTSSAAAASSDVHKAVSSSFSSSSSSCVHIHFREKVILHSFHLRHQLDEMHEVDQKVAAYTDVNRIVEYATKAARKMKRNFVPSMLHTAIKHNQLDVVSLMCDVCPFYALVEMWKREDADEKGVGANVLFDLVDEVWMRSNTLSQYALSTHPPSPPFQHISQHTLLMYAINPPYQPTLSTHPLNPPSTHPLNLHIFTPPPPLNFHPLDPPSKPTLPAHPFNTFLNAPS